MVERKWFTQEEAQDKVGRKIKTLVPFSGMPKDTTGSVIRADPAAGQVENSTGELVDGFNVAIQWDLPREPADAQVVIPTGAEPYLFVKTGKPLLDWFTRDEYEQYLEELDNQ